MRLSCVRDPFLKRDSRILTVPVPSRSAGDSDREPNGPRDQASRKELLCQEQARLPSPSRGKSLRRRRRAQMVLSAPPHPIFHFGMSGMAHVRGEPSPVYRVPRSKSAANDWPPKYMKCCLTFRADDGATSEWAFCDPRRLGRIKLVDCAAEDLESVSPLGDLGPFTSASSYAAGSSPIRRDLS